MFTWTSFFLFQGHFGVFFLPQPNEKEIYSMASTIIQVFFILQAKVHSTEAKFFYGEDFVCNYFCSIG